MVFRIFEIVYLLGWITTVVAFYKPMVWDRSPTLGRVVMATPIWAFQMLITWFVFLPMHLLGSSKPDQSK